jgi:hypothetical protein
VLVSVVLLGLGAAGTLGAMAAAVTGSDQHRQLNNAQTWLQNAADYLQGKPREDCDDVGGVAGEARARIRSTYESYVRSVPNPDGWPAARLTVLDPVLYWDGDQYQTTCYDNLQLNLQLVTLQVTSPDGSITRTLQVVDGD